VPKLNLICDHRGTMSPVDDEGSVFLNKHIGRTFTANLKVQRSPEHNRLFWAVANKAHKTLPDHYAQAWPTPYEMVKGLELAFGYTDKLMKPVKGGTWEVVQTPKSLDFGNMDQGEFNEVSADLFKGMAHALGITVDELLGAEEAA